MVGVIKMVTTNAEVIRHRYIYGKLLFFVNVVATPKTVADPLGAFVTSPINPRKNQSSKGSSTVRLEKV